MSCRIKSCSGHSNVLSIGTTLLGLVHWTWLPDSDTSLYPDTSLWMVHSIFRRESLGWILGSAYHSRQTVRSLQMATGFGIVPQYLLFWLYFFYECQWHKLRGCSGNNFCPTIERFQEWIPTETPGSFEAVPTVVDSFVCSFHRSKGFVSVVQRNDWIQW